MALRQLIPTFCLGKQFGLESTAVPKARKPEVVGFRAGASLEGVISAIKSKRYLVLDAAPGAGKTTRLPLELSRSVDVPVIHVFPFDLMAAKHHERAKMVNPGVSVCLELDSEGQWPEGRCWVFTSAACVVARWLSRGCAEMPECYLIHDESHESGFASATLRELGPVIPGVRSYVCATATSSPDGARVMETEGHVEDQEYESESFADPWSVEEDGAPWAVNGLDGHILLFEDDPKRAQALVQAYNYNGVSAYRFHSRMPVRTFLADMSRIESETVRLCAIIADSTFRSSFTFPVSVVVDSGTVQEVVVNDEGKPINHVRSIYEFERVQTRARGGRCTGQRTTYLRPRVPLAKTLCDLSQTDAEAMALVFRALGMQPPKIASCAKMATGKVPRDICAALRGGTPLAAIQSSQLVDADLVQWKNLGVKAVVAPAETVGSQESGVDTVQSDALSDLLVIADEPSLDECCLSANVYHYAQGVYTTDTESSFFPEGGVSVKRVLARSLAGVEHLGWSSYNRSVAVNALVRLHNAQLMELRAISAAVALVKVDGVLRSASELRKWAIRAAERLSFLAAEVTTNSSMAMAMAKGHCQLFAVNTSFGEQEHAWAKHMVSCLGSERPVLDTKEKEHLCVSSREDTDVALDLDFMAPRSRTGHKVKGVPSAAGGIVRWFTGYTPPRSLKPHAYGKRVERMTPSLHNHKGWVVGGSSTFTVSNDTQENGKRVTREGAHMPGRPPEGGGYPAAFSYY